MNHQQTKRIKPEKKQLEFWCALLVFEQIKILTRHPFALQIFLLRILFRSSHINRYHLVFFLLKQ